MSAWALFRFALLLGATGVVVSQSTNDNESREIQSEHMDQINLLIEIRKTSNQLRQMAEIIGMRFEIALAGVTELLQQPVVKSSASNTSSVEARLEAMEIRLENLGTGIGQLMQQTQQSLLLINGIPGVETRLETLEMRLENLGTGVGQLMQQTQQSLLLFNGTPGVEARLETVEMRLENLGTQVGQLMQCPCMYNNSVTTDFEFPLGMTTPEPEVTLLSSTNIMLTTDATPGTPTPTLAYALPGSSNVKAIASLNDQLFVSRWEVRYLYVFNTTSFQLLRNITIPGLGGQVYGLATCAGNNFLYVSDMNNNLVHRVDLSTNNAIQWNVASAPAGISVNRVRNVLVVCYEAKKVQEYTPSGSLLREISDSNSLWQAVELSSGMLAVTRVGPVHGIATVSMDGHVIHSYGSQAGSVGRMHNPRYFEVDQQGYFLVADQENHRIQVVNPSMTDARQLPLPLNINLHRPLSLSLDQSRGRLYVGEDGVRNRMLVFNNVSNVGALFIN